VAAPEVAALDARSLARLPAAALLGGYAGVLALVVGERYDVRFLADRLAVYRAGQPAPLAEVTYAQVEAVARSAARQVRVPRSPSLYAWRGGRPLRLSSEGYLALSLFWAAMCASWRASSETG
jgi:hypothetical protein